MATDPYDPRDPLAKAIAAAAGKGWTKTDQHQDVDGTHYTFTRGTTSVTVVFDADNNPTFMSIVTAVGRANCYYNIGPTLLAWLNRGS